MVNATKDEKMPIVQKNDSADIKLKIMDNGDRDIAEDFYPHNPFGENFDKQFWIEVSALNKSDENKTWSVALAECRLKKLIEKSEESDKNIIIYLMDIYDKFFNISQQRQESEFMPSLIQQVSEFVNLVLNEDYNTTGAKGKKRPIYSVQIEVNDEIEKTVLHFAAERNLSSIVKMVLKFYPRQCYRKCPCGGPTQQLAIELALYHHMDDTASILANHMSNESVRKLFEYDDVSKRVKFSFSEMTKDEKMKKTVNAVLDCLINPEFPYIPVDPADKKKDEDPWSKIPNKPQRYHVYYRLLDGDVMGRPARWQNGKENLDFDHKTPSGLYSIAHSPFSEDIIVHPAVRLLIQKKWNNYGAKHIGFYVAAYVFFLVSMSLAFFLNVRHGDRTQYDTKLDKARGFFEVLTFVISLIYAWLELVQVSKEGRTYWKNPFNYIDIIGITLILALLPVKLSVIFNTHSKVNPSEVEWCIASVAYLINVIRLFKWFPAINYVGVHVTLITRLLVHDIPQFLAVYSVVAIAFTGSIILALKATTDGFKDAGMDSWKVILQEVRALTETNGFSDSYIGTFKVAVIVLLMFNMFFCVLILANILIAHLSNVYTDAHNRADIQCDIDRVKIVSRLENSYYRKWNQRMKYYADAAYISDVKEVTDMLKFWEKFKSKEEKDEDEKNTRCCCAEMKK